MHISAVDGVAVAHVGSRHLVVSSVRWLPWSRSEDHAKKQEETDGEASVPGPRKQKFPLEMRPEKNLISDRNLQPATLHRRERLIHGFADWLSSEKKTSLAYVTDEATPVAVQALS